jgi:NADH-quinone oxidoreductase subunit A
VYYDFANILVFLVVGLGFIVVNLVLARLLRVKGDKSPGKLAIYECGEPTIGQAWIRFDIRFYTAALLFVVFDIEIALLFPWALVFRDFVERGLGWLAFFEALAFIVVLMAGLGYVWAKGDLDWTGPESAAPNVTSDTTDAPVKEFAPVPAPLVAAAEGAASAEGIGTGALRVPF